MIQLGKDNPHRPIAERPVWDPELIRRYDLIGPRYTSHPTATQFSNRFSARDWQDAVRCSNPQASPLSLYFHIPFCDTVCYCCGCNKAITAKQARAEPYLRALYREIELQAIHVNLQRPVHQLHFGGGTPTYISDEQLARLMATIDEAFLLLRDDTGKHSIEIHPQTVSPCAYGSSAGAGLQPRWSGCSRLSRGCSTCGKPL